VGPGIGGGCVVVSGVACTVQVSGGGEEGGGSGWKWVGVVEVGGGRVIRVGEWDEQ
jgi:hypothetical protein